MIKLYFKPVDPDLSTILLAGQHKRLWQEHGKNIINAFEAVTGVSFLQGVRVNVGYKGSENLPSQRYSLSSLPNVSGISLGYIYEYPDDYWVLSQLIHELGHTLIEQHHLSLYYLDYVKQAKRPLHTYEAHRGLFVFLIDVYYKALDSSIADTIIKERDKAYPYLYNKYGDEPSEGHLNAWKWARGLTPKKRKNFTELLFKQKVLILPEQ